jgi:hypothetical protein
MVAPGASGVLLVDYWNLLALLMTTRVSILGLMMLDCLAMPFNDGL